MATEAQIIAFLNTPGRVNVSGRDWRSSCQALMYQLCLKFGNAPVIYPTANAAYLKSAIVSTNPALALPGDFHFFDLNAADHVSLSMGGSRGLMGSSHCPDDAALNAGFMTVEAYCKASGAKYLGHARSNGANDIPIEIPQIVLAANQRRVKAIAKRRTTPTTIGANYNAADNFQPGATPVVDGFIRSALAGGTVGTEAIWLKVGSLYSHLSVFESSSLAGLIDLGTFGATPPVTPVEPEPPVVVVPDPVLHKVGFDTRIDGCVVTPYEVPDGGLLTPPTPVWEGHVFEGWFDTAGAFTTPFDFTQPITKEYLLVAIWAETPADLPVDPEPSDPTDPEPEPVPEGTVPDAKATWWQTVVAAVIAVLERIRDYLRKG